MTKTVKHTLSFWITLAVLSFLALISFQIPPEEYNSFHLIMALVVSYIYLWLLETTLGANNFKEAGSQVLGYSIIYYILLGTNIFGKVYPLPYPDLMKAINFSYVTFASVISAGVIGLVAYKVKNSFIFFRATIVAVSIVVSGYITFSLPKF